MPAKQQPVAERAYGRNGASTSRGRGPILCPDTDTFVCSFLQSDARASALKCSISYYTYFILAVSIPDRVKSLFSTPQRTTDCGAHPVFYPMGTEGKAAGA
jgi:hypothetical protein